MGVQYKSFIYSKHALVKMLERDISFEETEQAVCIGEIIKEYPNDKPYKSYLILAFVETRPLHVVVSNDNEGNCIVISVYEPDRDLWELNFKTKKEKQ